MKKIHVIIKKGDKVVEDFVGSKTAVSLTISEYLDMVKSGVVYQITLTPYSELFGLI